MPVQTKKKDYAKPHYAVVDKNINDLMTSLRWERVVNVSLYQPKNNIEQMSAVRIKMDALQELFEMEKTKYKMSEDNFLLMGEAPLATAPDERSKRYKALHAVNQTNKNPTQLEFENEQL